MMCKNSADKMWSEPQNGPQCGAVKWQDAMVLRSPGTALAVITTTQLISSSGIIPLLLYSSQVYTRDARKKRKHHLILNPVSRALRQHRDSLLQASCF